MKQQDKYRILPDLSNEQFEALKNDIAVRGILVPIEVDEVGTVLDGFERERAAKELGIKSVPFIVRAGLTEEQKIDHILRMNFARRHLSKSEKKKVALQLRTRGWPQGRIASDLAVSQKTISNWLDQEFSKISELTSVIGKDGKRYPPKRTEQLKEEPHVQEQQESGSNKDAEVSLLLSNLRDGGRQIEGHSIDLFLTHSPGVHPDLWHELAILAERVLKPGKLFVLCSGQERLPEIIRALSKRLQYVWTGSVILNNDPQAVSELHIDNESKLLLFFAGRPYEPGPWFSDTFLEVDGQESEMEASLIEQLTNPGDLIFDPFGSERVAVAAERMKRRFVRIEKDPDTAAKANQKLETLEPTPPSTKETDEFEQVLNRIAARNKKILDAGFGG
jgi:ParB-like chromosome segregation protein Spo0J